MALGMRPRRQVPGQAVSRGAGVALLMPLLAGFFLSFHSISIRLKNVMKGVQ